MNTPDHDEAPDSLTSTTGQRIDLRAPAFVKIVRIGATLWGSTFCKIKWDGSELSITGVEGPKTNGDCVGSCGQIVMSEWNFRSLAPGWTGELVLRFREVWNRFHLNHMRAGSPAQEAFLRANPVTAVYPVSHFKVASEALRAAGLQPDPSTLGADGRPYSYGSAWLREAVPEEVLDFLRSLPDADRTPAWV